MQLVECFAAHNVLCVCTGKPIGVNVSYHTPPPFICCGFCPTLRARWLDD